MKLVVNNLKNTEPHIKCCDGLKEILTLPSCSIDLVLTDLPYLISRETHFNTGGCYNSEIKGSRRKVPVTDFGDWDKTKYDYEGMINQFYRLLKPHGSLIMFYDIWKMQSLKEMCENANFKQMRLCKWEKTNPVPINSKVNYLTNSTEYFITCVKKGKPTFNSQYDRGVYSYPILHGKERTVHPTQKPLSLISDIVLKHSNVGDTVLDPFMGTGTTGVACLHSNRKFIGFEIQEDYFKISQNRIRGKL